jgi:hypothetical protein
MASRVFLALNVDAGKTIIKPKFKLQTMDKVLAV